MRKDLEDGFEIITQKLNEQGISRRDALKLLLSSGALFLAQDNAHAQTLNASKLKAKIVIVGGGLAGVSTAARLISNAENLDITIIEPNLKSVSYQPGNTLIGAGIYEKKDVMFDTKNFIPKGVNFINEKVIEFNPENNQLITDQKQLISYDYLVVAAGLVLDFTKIKGLEELGTLYTQDETHSIENFFKQSGACTVYNTNAAVHTWKTMQTMIEKAKQGKSLNAIFTHPATAIKCGGAPKKMMYLMNSRLNEVNARENVSMSFYANSSKMFAVKAYEDAIIEQYQTRDMQWNLQHNLTEVKLDKHIAVFDHFWQEKGAFDKDLDEYTMVEKHKKVEVAFDFLHVTPPMKAAPEIGSSSIGSKNGWVPVNQETLQHAKYNNIFALGDIAAVALGKMGGSVRKQYKVVVDNILLAIQGKELTAKYDGYTVCPIITDIGKVMLAEFDWNMKPTPSFPLDPTEERYIWWLLKLYVLKPMTQYGMLSGKI